MKTKSVLISWFILETKKIWANSEKECPVFFLLAFLEAISLIVLKDDKNTLTMFRALFVPEILLYFLIMMKNRKINIFIPMIWWVMVLVPTDIFLGIIFRSIYI